jgi:phosphoribosylanthranilate isomerase
MLHRARDPSLRTIVKICGLSTPEALETALMARADMVGFVHFKPSPRHLALEELACLMERVKGRAKRVVLTVDADEASLAAIASMQPDFVQLHGRETPDHVASIGERYHLKTIKALPIAEPADLDQIALHEPVADMLLFDARPPKTALIPGGNGQIFDWHVLQGLRSSKPWLLAGGLESGNVEEALSITRAPGVDVSSGVEDTPGVKNLDKIRAFVSAVRAAEQRPKVISA